MIKKCSKCKEHKQLDLFHKNKARYDGFCNFCKECAKNKPVNAIKKKESYEKWRNSEKGKAYFKNYYEQNKDKYKDSHENWVKNNHEKYKFLQRGYFQNPIRKKGHAANMAKRRSVIQKSIWGKYIRDIKYIYSNCPEGFHVDHIVPLQGKNVCGLHVPWNLQYLPASENLRKSNKHA